MTQEAIGQVRAFNRTVTQRIGALQEEYLARGRPLGASRLLWEVSSAGVDLRRLRARLGLDSGYLSRLLRRLESEGLVVVEADPGDRRVRVARLTDAGRAERAEIDRLSDDLAGSLLAPLDGAEQGRLVEAMTSVQRLLTIGMVAIEVEEPGSEAARFCLQSYFAELDSRFDDGFDPGASTTAGPQELTPPAGLLLVARLAGEPIGCGALKFDRGQLDDPGQPVGRAELKRLWVSPATRGLGLGRRLLRALEQHARASGVSVVRLDTNRVLREAITLYRSSGYAEVPAYNDQPYAHLWFAKQLDTG
jgi:DNA-binding MarR family transcriptional regulator/GNAT superfamily N-acetyltransferase